MKFTLKNRSILLTGATGFLGAYVFKELLRHDVPKRSIRIANRSEFNLLSQINARRATKDIDIVIHLAGNVGGIGKNLTYPGSLFYENAKMGIELIEAARMNKVKKTLIIGTVCSYPKYTSVPFHESDLWLGYPEETNAPYGLAKKMLLVQAQAYRKQYGMTIIYLIPANLYGPGDSANLETSHVIPALIRKMYDAKRNNKPSVSLWGDGSPTREFLYVADAARAIIMALEKYDSSEPINIGTGKEIRIDSLAKLIQKYVGYTGTIEWDRSRPNGQPKRMLDTSRANQLLKFKSRTPFDSGLKKTVQWYINKLK